MRQTAWFLLALVLLGCTVSTEVYGRSRWETYADNECGASIMPAKNNMEREEKFASWLEANPTLEIIEWRIFFGPPAAAAGDALQKELRAIGRRAHVSVRNGYDPFVQNQDLAAKPPPESVPLGVIIIYCPKVIT